MSVEKTKLTFLSKGRLDEEQVMVETIFNVPDMKKVLWSEAEAELETVDVGNGEVSFSGQTQFFITYLDQENKIKAFDNTVPFLSKIKNDNLTPETQVNLYACVSGVDCNASKGKTQCFVSINGAYLLQADTEILCGGDDKTIVKTEELSAQELLRAETVRFNEEISYPLTDKMENILAVRSRVCTKNIEANENFFLLTAEIHTCIKYLTISDEIEKISTVNFTEQVRREIEVSGLTEEDVVEAVACVEQSLYKYELDKETNKILINVPIKVQYRASSRVVIPSVVDMFSLSHQISAVTSSVSKAEILKSEFFENKIEGSVQIDVSEPRIDKVVGFSNPNVVVSEFNLVDDLLQVNGIIDFSIAFLNDEFEEITSQSHQIPFKIDLRIEDVSVVPSLVTACLTDTDIIVRRGREIYLDAKLKTMVQMKKDSIDAVLTDVEFGEELPVKTHAIEIYFGQKGDDLWSIAKEMKIKPDTIVEQNPELILPLEEPENIVVYSAVNR